MPTVGPLHPSGMHLVGNTDLRVTVPMPNNLAELKSAASHHFRGHSGMYHHGKHHVNHPIHFTNVQENDVIVLPIEDGAKEAPPITTHNAHYIKHDMEAKGPPPAKPPTPPRIKFDGQSRYAADYVKHPMTARPDAFPAKNMWDGGRRGGVQTGKSTYTTHYPWRDAVKPPCGKARPDNTERGLPFDGTSMYSSEFVSHPIQPRKPIGPEQRPVAVGPFEGVTTYSLDYKKYKADERRPLMVNKQNFVPNSGPFEGSTEYMHEYLKHDLEARKHIHLEPELRRVHPDGRRASGSAAPGVRPGSGFPGPPSVAGSRRGSRPPSSRVQEY